MTGGCTGRCAVPEFPNAGRYSCKTWRFIAVAEFCILTRDLPRAETLALVAAAGEAGHTVALMSPCEGQDRQMLCRQIVAAHRSTTVDNRGYLLIFNNNLPKQHFRI